MNNEFKIMLAQCEKQAKKLADADISDVFFDELDIFDNYFNQLKQIIENDNVKPNINLMTNLQKYMESFTEKLKTHKGKILEQAKNAGKINRIQAYSISSAHDGALKFDKRS